MTEERKRYLNDLVEQLLMLDLEESNYVQEKVEEDVDRIIADLFESCEECDYL